MIELLAISSHRKADADAYTFSAQLRLDGKMIDVALSVDCLRNYATFQSRILLACGQMVRICHCEGRLPEAADSEWRMTVKLELSESAKAKNLAASAASEKSGKGLN